MSLDLQCANEDVQAWRIRKMMNEVRWLPNTAWGVLDNPAKLSDQVIHTDAFVAGRNYTWWAKYTSPFSSCSPFFEMPGYEGERPGL
jgi:hypothetical protein